MIEPIQKKEEPAASKGRQLKERYEGHAKVTGTARYAADFALPRLVYGFVVQSTIANGTIVSIDRTVAERSYGVLSVLTPFNAPKLPVVPAQTPGSHSLSLLPDTSVFYNGQPIGIVVATSLDAARQAAAQLQVTYRPLPAKLDFMGRLNEARPPRQPGRDPADTGRGDFEALMGKD